MNIELLESKAQALRETSKVLRAAITMLEESAKQAEQAANEARALLDAGFWEYADSEIEKACAELEA